MNLDEMLTVRIRMNDYARAYDNLEHMKGVRDNVYDELTYLKHELHDEYSAYYQCLNSIFTTCCYRINQLKLIQPLKK